MTVVLCEICHEGTLWEDLKEDDQFGLLCHPCATGIGFLRKHFGKLVMEPSTDSK
jgi:hypothetical protein